MNKQELIEKYVYMKRNLEMWVCIPDILKDLKQLDEPQKVKIPKFVAECIEYAQASDWDLEDVFQSIANELDTSEISVWFYSKSENMDTLASAWLYGYEIEKEKRYIVKMKGVVSGSAYLKQDTKDNYWYFGTDSEKGCIAIKHTQKELEKAWDKRDKEIYLADEINWDDGKFDYIGDAITFYRGADEVELMLSTNTKDKNDKEIFEGDVLQIDYIKAIVRFGQYRYYDSAGKDVLTGNGFYLECLNVMDPDCISPYETDILDKAEIIGNIYETPEYDQNFVGFRIKGE